MPRLVNLASPGVPYDLYIEVETGTICYHFCPNTITVEAFKGLPHLTQPGTTSELSGQPGFFYRTANYDGKTLTLRLSREEIYRLVSRSLTPDEVRKILDTHGLFHEIHGDFYEDDGTARQPKELPPLPSIEQLLANQGQS